MDARVVVWEAADVVKVPAGCAVPRADGGWAVFAAATARPGHAGARRPLERAGGGGAGRAGPGDHVVLHPSDRVKDGVYENRDVLTLKLLGEDFEL